MQRFLPVIFAAVGVLLFAGSILRIAGAGTPGSFDRLTDSDRQSFQRRFEREVWPLLLRGGKDGCVGCHTPKHRSTLRFSGNPGEDFRALLKEGFFLVNDAGNLVSRIETSDRKQKMPPGDRPRWADEDIQVLRRFTADVQRKQRP